MWGNINWSDYWDLKSHFVEVRESFYENVQSESRNPNKIEEKERNFKTNSTNSWCEILGKKETKQDESKHTLSA